ncbi:MAG: hypothetical protein RI906_3138 [Pseudomonadota bacterium]|jgi:uncharacterized membrane protein
MTQSSSGLGIAAMTEARLRQIVLGLFIALIVLGLAWELWLAPLRPGAWLMSLKVLPLVIALPSLWRAQLRTFQWWSMLVMIYLTEGLVRGMSDPSALSAALGWLEAVLSGAAFAAILLYTRSRRPPKPETHQA